LLVGEALVRGVAPMATLLSSSNLAVKAHSLHLSLWKLDRPPKQTFMACLHTQMCVGPSRWAAPDELLNFA
jgi:hypothetical protein